MKIVLATVFLAITAAHANVPQLDGRIVGGEDVKIEDFPYQLSLLLNGRHYCGASIISVNYALTAAHCINYPSSSYQIRAGSDVKNVGGQVVDVKAIHVHEQYDSDTTDYDIAIIELASPLTLGATAAVIALPEVGEEVVVGEDTVVSGWGALQSGGSSPSQLQAVHVNIVDRKECQEAYSRYWISDRMICAGVANGGKDACQGDSGGPLVSNGKQVGIVSWGVGCASPDYPGVYSNVENLRGFVKEITGI